MLPVACAPRVDLVDVRCREHRRPDLLAAQQGAVVELVGGGSALVAQRRLLRRLSPVPCAATWAAGRRTP